MGDSDRTPAYAALLSALLDVRSDPATARFDAELAAAEARGTLDGATARTLRWWQRESVRALSDHLADVLPGLLASLSDADRAAVRSIADSEASWSAATERAAEHEHAPEAARIAPAPPSRTHAAAGRASSGPTAGTAFYPASDPDAASSSPAPAPARPDPAPSTTPTASPSPSSPTAQGVDYGAPRHRLLVAGLTVLGDGEGPDSTPAAPTP